MEWDTWYPSPNIVFPLLCPVRESERFFGLTIRRDHVVPGDSSARPDMQDGPQNDRGVRGGRRGCPYENTQENVGPALRAGRHARRACPTQDRAGRKRAWMAGGPSHDLRVRLRGQSREA